MSLILTDKNIDITDIEVTSSVYMNINFYNLSYKGGIYMKAYLNNKKTSVYLGNKKIQVIIYEKINDDGKVTKTFYLDVPDSTV